MRSSPPFERLVFERKVNDALKSVERVLDIERHPRLAGDVDHTYGSKYALVDATTNAALIAYMNVFDKMGLNGSVLKSIDKKKATTIRFDANTSCKFEKEVVVHVPISTVFEEETKTKSTGMFGNSERKKVSKVVQHVTEFHYTVKSSWSLSVYSGTSVQEQRVIKSRTSSTNIITQSKGNPIPEPNNFPPQDLSLTWLLQQIDTENLTSQFKVDTEDDETKTPRRNTATEKAIDFSEQLSKWSNAIRSIFVDGIADNLLRRHNPALPQPQDFSFDMLARLNTIHERYSIFNPILPLMEESTSDEEPSAETALDSTEPHSHSTITLQYPNKSADDAKTMLSVKDLSKLVNEHVRTLEVAIDEILKTCPNAQSHSVISCSEFELFLLSGHVNADLCNNYIDSMCYIESMIETQLISAVGKRLTADDLDAFIRFHNARLLSPAPKPFSLAIRRPNHYPVGLLSIESVNSDNDECIYSHSRVVNAGSPFNIPLNAATTLELEGDQILHGWLQHRFGPSRNSYHLVTRARQFSAFILVIGTMTGPTTLQPKDAIIVQNKDEIFIPLLLSELPTATEFNDAVKSLSPKQQQFARAFRSMQLASSVFGVCVIQIKPQLESLLGLPPDALDKEMKLTQDLMELFVDYQVPSDLLSYNGVTSNVANADKISNVRQNVQAVIDVIDQEKEKQLKAAKLQTEMAVEGAFQRAFDSEETGDTDNDISFVADAAQMSYACASPKRHLARGSKRPAKAMAMAASKGKKMARAAPPPMAMDGWSARPMAIDAHPRMEMGAMAALDMCVYAAMAAPPPIAMEMAVSGPDSVQYEDSPHHAKAMENDQGVTQTKAASMEIKKDTSSGQQGGLEQSHSIVDFTLVPKVLDAAVEKSGKDTSLRSTVLKTSDSWIRNRHENLLTSSKKQKLDSDDIKTEKNKAFDLLDALSRSGSLPIKYSELHVMVAVTHCFEKDVIDTVVCDNVDPIEKIEMSTLLFASTVHGIPVRELIKDSKELHRLERSVPLLLQQQEDLPGEVSAE